MYIKIHIIFLYKIYHIQLKNLLDIPHDPKHDKIRPPKIFSRIIQILEIGDKVFKRLMTNIFKK